jgi:hypothetical protein
MARLKRRGTKRLKRKGQQRQPIKTRQSERTRRQAARQEKQQTRQGDRTTRQSARQEKRTTRQATRQENRTRRTAGRQAIRMEKVVQKGESGYWSPEGVTARRMGSAAVVGASGQIVSEVAPLIMAGVTGGASGMGDIFGSLGSFAGDGESDLQGFGGANVFEPGFQPQETGEISAMSGFDFSFSNPLVIAGAVGTAGLLWYMTRKK